LTEIFSTNDQVRSENIPSWHKNGAPGTISFYVDRRNGQSAGAGALACAGFYRIEGSGAVIFSFISNEAALLRQMMSRPMGHREDLKNKSSQTELGRRRKYCLGSF
jgi:hypothetical protein